MHVPSDEPVVTLTSGPATQMRLTLSDPQRPWADDFVDYLVRVEGHGLTAESPVTSIAGDSLATFLADVAEAFRGWTGTRTWRSLEDQFRLEATWSSRGRVTLRAHLRPKVGDEPWDLTVDLEVEAGAEMLALAGAVAAFFDNAS